MWGHGSTRKIEKQKAEHDGFLNEIINYLEGKA
jgi:hypothetical protein